MFFVWVIFQGVFDGGRLLDQDVLFLGQIAEYLFGLRFDASTAVVFGMG